MAVRAFHLLFAVVAMSCSATDGHALKLKAMRYDSSPKASQLITRDGLYNYSVSEHMQHNLSCIKLELAGTTIKLTGIILGGAGIGNIAFWHYNGAENMNKDNIEDEEHESVNGMLKNPDSALSKLKIVGIPYNVIEGTGSGRIQYDQSKNNLMFIPKAAIELPSDRPFVKYNQYAAKPYQMIGHDEITYTPAVLPGHIHTIAYNVMV